jgi:hypothetical protein
MEQMQCRGSRKHERENIKPATEEDIVENLAGFFLLL